MGGNDGIRAQALGLPRQVPVNLIQIIQRGKTAHIRWGGE